MPEDREVTWWGLSRAGRAARGTTRTRLPLAGVTSLLWFRCHSGIPGSSTALPGSVTATKCVIRKDGRCRRNDRQVWD